VTVRDAGVAVGGAATTRSSGTASLKGKTAEPESLRVSVSKDGCADATASIKITR
jgi:hypothetical protein